MQKLNFRWWLAIIYLVLLTLYFINRGAANVVTQKLIYLVAPLVSLVSGKLTLDAVGWQGKRATVLKIFLFGLILWFIGEAYTAYMAWIKVEYYPSLSDVLYWIGYLLFPLAFILEMKLFNLRLNQLPPLVLTILGFAFTLVALVIGYIAVTIGYKPQESLLVNFATISWSIGDFITGTLGLILFAMSWQYKQGMVKKAWIWVAYSFFVFLIADIIYDIYPDALYAGSPLSMVLDFTWMGCYMLIAGFFLQILEQIKTIQIRSPS
jgi:hypothetical protein